VWNDEGQALIEFALGLPLVILASFYAFGLLDAAATQEGVESGARRAANAVAGSNDDAQGAGAAAGTPWLRGQQISLTITPDGSQLRCAGTPVTVRLTAPGHLGFLLLVPAAWTATRDTVIEAEGAQAGACAGSP
jgi:Flp pilus assembly protein TadG